MTPQWDAETGREFRAALAWGPRPFAGLLPAPWIQGDGRPDGRQPGCRQSLQLESHDLRFIHLRLGDSEEAALLDIVQWHKPETKPADPIASQMQRGITRFAVLAESGDTVYEEMKAAGAKIITEPTTVITPQDGWRVSLIEDPDGVVVQITQLLPPPAQ